MQGSRGETTRCGSDVISTTLETWSGAVRVTLRRDGSFTVETGEKSSPRHLIIAGNVDEGTTETAEDYYN